MSLGDSFDEVLAAARRGEEWALRAIYEELAPRIRGYLQGQGEADPDELLGAIFLQIVGDLANFDGDESAFRAWVLSIAHHRLVEEGRGLEPAAGSVAQPAARSGGDREAERLTAAHENGGDALLAELSSDQRSVVLLRAVGELTVEQVADLLDKDPGEVQQLQHGGLAALTRQEEIPTGAEGEERSRMEELGRGVQELSERSVRQLTWLVDSLAERARLLQRESESMVRALEDAIARIREVASPPPGPRPVLRSPESEVQPDAERAAAPRVAGPQPVPAEHVRRRRAEHPTGAGHEEALLRATQMAIGGKDRAEIEAALRSEFGVARPDQIVDLILGPARR